MNLILEDHDDELQERSIKNLVYLLMSNALMKNKFYVLSDN